MPLSKNIFLNTVKKTTQKAAQLLLFNGLLSGRIVMRITFFPSFENAGIPGPTRFVQPTRHPRPIVFIYAPCPITEAAAIKLGGVPLNPEAGDTSGTQRIGFTGFTYSIPQGPRWAGDKKKHPDT